MRCIHYLWQANVSPATTLRALGARSHTSVIPASVMPSGIALLLLIVWLMSWPVYSQAPDSTPKETQKHSGWELSIANGMLVFKQESRTEFIANEPSSEETTDMTTDESFEGTSTESQQSLFLLAIDSKMSTDVSGIVARSTLTQTFRNPGDDWLSGQYQFPLPENAAVDALKMRIGKREIVGQIQEKKQAQANFQRAKVAGKKASLVSQQRPNLFTTSVANIGPFEEIQIEIQFQQQVQFSNGEFRLRLPTTFTPRFGGSFELDEQLQQFSAERRSLDFNLTLNAGEELAYLKSPYYSAAIHSGSDKVWRLQTAPGQVADRDIELNWRFNSQQPALMHFSESTPEGEYGLLMLVPGLTVPEYSTPRDITFVIDTSSSMAGASIAQAKSALLTAINQLNAEDAFNIVEFNSNANALWPSMLSASERNRRIASDYVQSLEANGGTNIYDALEQAMTVQRSSDNLQQLVFITDGAIGYEDDLLIQLRKQLGPIRLFTVGIGAAPNSYFMVEAALAGRGTYTYIAQQNQVQSRMQELFSKLSQPVLRDIKIDLGVPAQVYPQHIPDLYQGEPLLISYRTEVPVSDIRAVGKAYEGAWQVSLTQEVAAQHPGIAKRWAREKIASLLRQQRSNSNIDPEVKLTWQKQVIATALQHQLVSPFTSLVAIDSQNARYSSEETRLMANMPATALGTGQHLVIALILLFIAAILTVWHGFERPVLLINRGVYVAK